MIKKFEKLNYKMKKFDEKKEMIKQAGIKSFAAYGYNKTTLEDIAGMLGMKKNSLYYYFESKDALFREIIEDEIASFIEHQKKILKEDLPAYKKLNRIIDTWIEFIHERTVKYTIRLSSYLEISKVIHNTFPDFPKRQRTIIHALLKEGIANKEFREHNARQLASDINDLIPAIFNNHYINSDAEFVYGVDFDRIAREIKRLVSYIIDGIKIK